MDINTMKRDVLVTLDQFDVMAILAVALYDEAFKQEYPELVEIMRQPDTNVMFDINPPHDPADAEIWGDYTNKG